MPIKSRIIFFYLSSFIQDRCRRFEASRTLKKGWGKKSVGEGEEISGLPISIVLLK